MMTNDEIVERVAKLLMAYGESEFGPDFADGIILDAKEGHNGDCPKCEPNLVGAFTCSACMVENARSDAVQFIEALTANGMMVVPVEPTEIQRSTGADVITNNDGHITKDLVMATAVYRAMTAVYRAMTAARE